MSRISHLASAFLLSLSLVGVSIYFFIEDNDSDGKLFLFLAIYVFITLFYVFRSFYYLRHQATFNEVIFVFILPIIPVLLILAQMAFGLEALFVISSGSFSTESINYTFYVEMMDFLLVPYYILSTYVLFRTFIRYPFIRFRATSEKGIPPKFAGFLLTLLIPTLYILTSLLYFEDFFLVIFGIIYLYSGIMAIFI